MNIIQEAKVRVIEYDKIWETCYSIFRNRKDVVISVIIPVYGRTQFNNVVTDHFKRSIDFIKDKSITVSVTIVEHSAEPEHNSICKDWVNHIWIPKFDNRFNKCLAHNIGAIYSNKSKYLLFHDIDTLVPQNFFEKLLANMKGHHAIQSFTKQRLLHANERITDKFLKGEVVIEDVYEGHEDIEVAKPGAEGGSMFVNRDVFFNVGGFDDLFCSEYSVEDSFFYYKLKTVCKLGYANNPPIEMVHLYHTPSFERTTKREDFDAYNSFNNLRREHKLMYMDIRSKQLKKYL